MAIKYNPYGWAIRPSKNKNEIIKLDVDIDEEKLKECILKSGCIKLRIKQKTLYTTYDR